MTSKPKAKLSKPILGAAAVSKISESVDRVFDIARLNFLGPSGMRRFIGFAFNRKLSLPGMFEAANIAEGTNPNLDALERIIKVTDSYFNSVREHTKATVLHAIENHLKDAHIAGADTDLEMVLNDKLQYVFKQAATKMKTIAETELNVTKNVGVLDGIVKRNAEQGVEDPVVYFISVKDKDRCEECTRLHTLEDEVTPRVWLLSEVGSGYHKRGESNPKMAGLHCNCRCSLATCHKDWGFAPGSSKPKYMGQGYSVLNDQREGKGWPDK